MYLLIDDTASKTTSKLQFINFSFIVFDLPKYPKCIVKFLNVC